jgi:hypothetical protein
VADDDALRSRRKRAHAAGDHRLCRRCAALRGGMVPAASPVADGGPVDPQASLEALARRLEDAHRAEPGNALLARELRMTLGKLAGGDGADDGLAEFLTRLSG